MVFGVFDGLHDGHKAFLTEARAHGERLVVVVASCTNVGKTKGYCPLNQSTVRMETIQKFMPEAIVLKGDQEDGSWTALSEFNPEIIVTGYDQSALREALEALHFPSIKQIITAQPHRGNELHSSILRQKM